jgi:hypothetical protein
MRYISKPVVIEAISFLGPYSVDEMHVEWGQAFADAAVYRGETNELVIHTREGLMRADVGDYIIKGTINEFYPCKPRVFATKYAPAETPQ